MDSISAGRPHSYKNGRRRIACSDRRAGNQNLPVRQREPVQLNTDYVAKWIHCNGFTGREISPVVRPAAFGAHQGAFARSACSIALTSEG
ncbi:MAG: hypothetical protein M3N23_00385, partial [Pseudomonadota bacterium]|nr:hypothetical protein [Pseudomonadota bacterium]